VSAYLPALAAVLVLIGATCRAQEPPNYEILRDASVFGMCQEPRDADDIEALAGMGVDVVVRGISCAWRATPDQARQRMLSKRELRDLARKHGICFCTMITSSAIYPEMEGPEKVDTWASRDARGNVIKTAGWFQGCLNNPEYRDYVKRIGRAVIDGGADGIHYDESYSRWFWMSPIPCFCDHCCARLREFIKRAYGVDQARERWGIADLDAFDYRRYLADNGYADAPHKSPLHDVWWQMQMHSTYEHETSIVQDNKRYALEQYGRELVTNANPYNAAVLSSAVSMETAVYDFVNIGTGLAMSFRDNGWRSGPCVPGGLSYVPQYKMARTQAGSKPVVMFLDIQQEPRHIARLKPDQADNMMQWLFAEAYASGCFFAAHHRFSAYDGPIAAQQRYGSFYKANRALFVGSRQVANVAVAYSYPSQVWDMYPLHWDKSSDRPAHCLQYYGVCQALQRANLQYETVFFGDGELFAAAPAAEELDRYRAIILPSCYAMTDEGARALLSYVDRGGRLIISGDYATHDEHHVARAQPPAAPTGPNIAHLDGDFEACLSGDHAEIEASLCRALVGQMHVTPLVELQGLEPGLHAHCRLSGDGQAYVVHLINTRFDESRGFSPATNVRLELTLPEGFGTPSGCYLLGPDYADGQPIPATMLKTAAGRVVVVAPEVNVFRAVVIRK